MISLKLIRRWEGADDVVNLQDAKIVGFEYDYWYDTVIKLKLID